MDLNEKITDIKGLRSKYWKFIIPSIIAQVVFTVYTMVDALMVARGVGAEALAGVNIASPYVTVIWAVSIMFSVGTSTMVARKMGEGNSDDADSIFSQTVAVLVVFSAAFSITSFICAEYIADFLGATAGTHDYVVQYIRWISPFTVFYITSYLFEILMPVDGFPKLASILVSVGAVSNCILDYLFIFIFKWGVWGAALATSLAQVIVSSLYVIHFLGKKSHIKFRRFHFKPDLILQEMWRGLPAGVADLSPGIAVFIFVRFIGRFIGEKGLIAYSAVGYVSTILIIIGVAVGQGSQPLVSYYNGAKRPDIIRSILKFEIKDVAVISILAFAATELAAPWIVRLFIPNESAETIEYAIVCFRYFITFSVIDVYSIIISQYATALEHPLTGVLIGLLRTTVFLIAGILIMMAVLGPQGIFLGMTVSEIFTLTMALTIYKKKKGFLK